MEEENYQEDHAKLGERKSATNYQKKIWTEKNIENERIMEIKKEKVGKNYLSIIC